MNVLYRSSKKNVFWLAFFSVLTSVLFSFVGAPFLRALFTSTRSVVFWTIAATVVGALLILGFSNYKVSETAVYVGATWMTLGIYSELEKRGASWKIAGLFSLVAGLTFSVAGYFLVLKHFYNQEVLNDFTVRLETTLKETMPFVSITPESFIYIIPGVFTSGLFFALATGVIFEKKALRLFRLKQERVITSIRWSEFRLPDVAIWVFLFTLFFWSLNIVSLGYLRHLAVGVLVLFVSFFILQGLTIVEFAMRHYRIGSVTRLITYLLIFLQLLPLVLVLGAVDYWADFRKLMRKKRKQNILK